MPGFDEIIKAKAEGELPPSWATAPTRVIILTLNYINDNLGMLMEIKVILFKTNEGLWVGDFSTNRARFNYQKDVQVNLILV